MKSMSPSSQQEANQWDFLGGGSTVDRCVLRELKFVAVAILKIGDEAPGRLTQLAHVAPWGTHYSGRPLLELHGIAAG